MPVERGEIPKLAGLGRAGGGETVLVLPLPAAIGMLLLFAD